MHMTNDKESGPNCPSKLQQQDNNYDKESKH